jgi:fatty-acyl-CoA synthase
MSPIDLAARAILEARSLGALARAGLLPLTAPHHLPAIALAMRAYGPFGGAIRAAATRHGSFPAIRDERGEISYADLDRTTNQLSNVLRAAHPPGSTVGILMRNHRNPLIVAWAASRAGLNTVWLNTAFSPRQATEVAEREGVDVLFCDADLAHLAEGLSVPVITTDIAAPTDDLDAYLSPGSPSAPPRPAKPGRLVLLTSGTTGTPKGAPRTEPRGYTLPGSLLDRMPMRSRETVLIGPPLFHGTGLVLTLLALGMGSKVVLRRSFDPETFLTDIEQHGVSTVCTVPVMLQRLLALGPERIKAADTSALRIVFVAGSALPAAVSAEFQDLFGDVIYNLYGSTEVSVATFATPDVVRAAPTSVGKPALGSRVVLIGDDGKPVPTGERGRVFVGTVTPFEGYTGGGQKEIIDGMLSTGDVGHFDADGLLYIDGRDDDMIVSGGENVFPAEVEELLVTHDAVDDAAVIGVPDDDFGMRLRAFVVCHPGSTLSAEDVRTLVRDNLARYKVPRDVVFLDELPRNPTGKVLKRTLQEWS